MKKWAARIVSGLMGILLAALAFGVVAEQLARLRAPRDFPPLGRMVDIGGRRIQIDCRGTGSPVVVFEANDLEGSLGWSVVQNKVARFTRACSYSRAGIMWSDPAPGPRDDKAIAQDLHTVLSRAGESPPFVMVGHSLAGLYGVIYAKYFGSEVAGTVLVDSAHPAQAQKIEAITHRKVSVLSPIAKVMAKLAWTGLPRLLFGSATPKGMEATAAYAPTSLSTMAEELKTIDKTISDAAAFHDLGARPLYVLTAMAPASPAALSEMQMTAEEDRRFRPIWKQLHEDEATWSSNSQLLLLPDSGHRIQTDKPDVVAHAVISVIEAVRTGQSLRP